MAEPLLFTLKSLHDRTVEIIEEVNVSGVTAVITHKGRFVATIQPFPVGIESRLINEHLKANPEILDQSNVDPR
jgi:antitoxin (DNA-binding transcriptional repressor) of toxin-antitoxin stability system